MIRIFLTVFINLLFLLSSQGSSLSSFPRLQNQFENDTTYVKELLSESLEAINQGRFTAAFDHIDKAKQLSDSLNYLDGQALSAARYADAYLNQQKLDSAIAVLNRAFVQYPKSKRLIDFYNLMATALQYKSRGAEAIEFYNKALELIPNMPKENQARTTAGIRHNMAGAFLDQGNYTQAFENYLIAVRFSEMTRDTVFWVTTLNNIGNAYNSIENYSEAVFYLEKGKAVAQEVNLKVELYRIYLNLGNSYSGLEEYDKAKSHYETALKLEQEIRPGSPPVVILYNLGKLNADAGNYAEAEKNYRESLQYSTEAHIIQGIYFNNYGLGDLYYRLQRYEEAIEHLNIALTTAEQIQVVPFIQESREILYKAYRESGSFKDAYKVLEQYHIASDSLFTIEKEQALANMESQLALDRQNEINQLLQEKQVQQERRILFQLILIITALIIIFLVLFILFLMRRRGRERDEINKQLLKQKNELEEANQAKNKLFSIVAHDLRTPLASLQGILFLIKNKALSQEEMQNMAEKLEVSVQQNVETMEDILVWANEQISGVKMYLEKLDLKNIIDDVVKNHSSLFSSKNLNLQNNSNHVQVTADKNALQLVLRNLLSNAAKFTPADGNITITTETINNSVLLKVQDSGIGIAPEDTSKVFGSKPWSRRGTENEKGTGYGMNISKEFIQKMNGSLRFESKVNSGTTFIVEIPQAEKEPVH